MDITGRLRILYAQDFGSCGTTSLTRAMDRVRADHPGLEFIVFETATLDANEKVFCSFLDLMMSADLTIVRFYGGACYFGKYDRLLERARGSKVNLFVKSTVPEDMSDVRDCFRMSDRDQTLLDSYLELGGEANETSLALWAVERFLHAHVTVPEPSRPVPDGLYHPDVPDGAVMSRYMGRHIPGHPTIGLMFHQSLWLSRDLNGVNAIVRELESIGNNVVAVFFSSTPSDVNGSIGVRGAIKKYFLDPDGPREDVLLLNTGFSQLVLSDPGDGSVSGAPKENIFEELNVPVIQIMNTFQSKGEWSANDNGLTFFELSSNVVWPEYDGQIITFPVASTETLCDGTQVLQPLNERIRTIAKAAMAWATLRRTPVRERKVAVLLHQNPPRNNSIGDAFGLDAPSSTVKLMNAMNDRGYLVDDVPNDGDELVAQILSGLTNDSAWTTPEITTSKAAAVIDGRTYKRWFGEVPDGPRGKMIKDWGDPPGQLFCVDGILAVPGRVYGNIFIGLQPPRSDPQGSDANYHNMDLSLPHSYLAYYRWIKEVFGANAVIHMGCHGTHEWLPGKSVGLSHECFPDIVLGDLPNIYPYAIGNPGEGVQAKRRGYAVLVDHLPPALMRADLYPELADLESDIQSYMHARSGGEKEKSDALLSNILSVASRMNLLDDIGVPCSVSLADFEGHVPRLYDYTQEIKDTLIKDGLHILGVVPSDDRLDETIYSIMRLRNGEVPSLRDCVMACAGVGDPDGAIAVGTTAIDAADDLTMGLIREMHRSDFNMGPCLDLAERLYPESGPVKECVRYICGTLVPNIRMAGDEISSVLDGLDGGYVPPGPSGVISRGNAHILPTGRNFYSIDPSAIPTQASWDVGRRMADQMVERHKNDHGAYPESVGMVLFATDTMKTGGDDIAYVLWLLGLRPRWAAKGGKVLGLEVIPVKELGRPRIDVTMRITGLFRDSFPNLIEMMDKGVREIGGLNESAEENLLRKHLQKELVDLLKDGLGTDEARTKALIRIFGDPPRNYGGGVDRLIETSLWTDVNDIASSYVEWGCYAYGNGIHGDDERSQFVKRLSSVDVTVKNQSSREMDILDNDDDYIFHGGMVAAVTAYKGSAPASMIGDGADPERTRVRTVAEEASAIFRSRVLNPKWVEGLKRHGYRGAKEVSSLVDFTFGWDATSGIIEPWMYQGIAERFLFDKENMEWLEKVNPDALKQMSGRMLEAIDRGMWEASEETRQKLESIYLKQESRLEGDSD